MALDSVWAETGDCADVPLKAYRGCSARVKFRMLVRDDLGEIIIAGAAYRPQDLTGCTVSATGKLRRLGVVAVSAVIGSPANDGWIQVDLTSATTATFPEVDEDAELGRYSVTVTDGTLTVRPLSGAIIVQAE